MAVGLSFALLDSPPMRRWLSIFLLVLMPMLSTWSVASAYAADTLGAPSQHVGHHLDTHDKEAFEGSTGAPSAGVAEAECDHCHNPAATPFRFADSARLPAPDLPDAMNDVTLRAPPLALPERPNWARFA